MMIDFLQCMLLIFFLNFNNQLVKVYEIHRNLKIQFLNQQAKSQKVEVKSNNQTIKQSSLKIQESDKKLKYIHQHGIDTVSIATGLQQQTQFKQFSSKGQYLNRLLKKYRWWKSKSIIKFEFTSKKQLSLFERYIKQSPQLQEYLKLQLSNYLNSQYLKREIQTNQGMSEIEIISLKYQLLESFRGGFTGGQYQGNKQIDQNQNIKGLRQKDKMIVSTQVGFIDFGRLIQINRQQQQSCENKYKQFIQHVVYKQIVYQGPYQKAIIDFTLNREKNKLINLFTSNIPTSIESNQQQPLTKQQSIFQTIRLKPHILSENQSIPNILSNNFNLFSQLKAFKQSQLKLQQQKLQQQLKRKQKEQNQRKQLQKQKQLERKKREQQRIKLERLFQKEQKSRQQLQKIKNNDELIENKFYRKCACCKHNHLQQGQQQQNQQDNSKQHNDISKRGHQCSKRLFDLSVKYKNSRVKQDGEMLSLEKNSKSIHNNSLSRGKQIKAVNNSIVYQNNVKIEEQRQEDVKTVLKAKRSNNNNSKKGLLQKLLDQRMSKESQRLIYSRYQNSYNNNNNNKSKYEMLLKNMNNNNKTNNNHQNMHMHQHNESRHVKRCYCCSQNRQGSQQVFKYLRAKKYPKIEFNHSQSVYFSRGVSRVIKNNQNNQNNNNNNNKHQDQQKDVFQSQSPQKNNDIYFEIEQRQTLSEYDKQQFQHQFQQFTQQLNQQQQSNYQQSQQLSNHHYHHINNQNNQNLTQYNKQVNQKEDKELQNQQLKKNNQLDQNQNQNLRKLQLMQDHTKKSTQNKDNFNKINQNQIPHNNNLQITNHQNKQTQKFNLNEQDKPNLNPNHQNQHQTYHQNQQKTYNQNQKQVHQQPQTHTNIPLTQHKHSQQSLKSKLSKPLISKQKIHQIRTNNHQIRTNNHKIQQNNQTIQSNNQTSQQNNQKSQQNKHTIHQNDHSKGKSTQNNNQSQIQQITKTNLLKPQKSSNKLKTNQNQTKQKKTQSKNKFINKKPSNTIINQKKPIVSTINQKQTSISKSNLKKSNPKIITLKKLAQNKQRLSQLKNKNNQTSPKLQVQNQQQEQKKQQQRLNFNQKTQDIQKINNQNIKQEKIDEKVNKKLQIMNVEKKQSQFYIKKEQNQINELNSISDTDNDRDKMFDKRNQMNINNEVNDEQSVMNKMRESSKEITNPNDINSNNSQKQLTLLNRSKQKEEETVQKINQNTQVISITKNYQGNQKNRQVKTKVDQNNKQIDNDNKTKIDTKNNKQSQNNHNQLINNQQNQLSDTIVEKGNQQIEKYNTQQIHINKKELTIKRDEQSNQNHLQQQYEKEQQNTIIPNQIIPNQIMSNEVINSEGDQKREIILLERDNKRQINLKQIHNNNQLLQVIQHQVIQSQSKQKKLYKKIQEPKIQEQKQKQKEITIPKTKIKNNTINQQNITKNLLSLQQQISNNRKQTQTTNNNVNKANTNPIETSDLIVDNQYDSRYRVKTQKVSKQHTNIQKDNQEHSLSIHKNIQSQKINQSQKSNKQLQQIFIQNQTQIPNQPQITKDNYQVPQSNNTQIENINLQPSINQLNKSQQIHQKQLIQFKKDQSDMANVRRQKQTDELEQQNSDHNNQKQQKQNVSKVEEGKLLENKKDKNSICLKFKPQQKVNNLVEQNNSIEEVNKVNTNDQSKYISNQLQTNENNINPSKKTNISHQKIRKQSVSNQPIIDNTEQTQIEKVQQISIDIQKQAFSVRLIKQQKCDQIIQTNKQPQFNTQLSKQNPNYQVDNKLQIPNFEEERKIQSIEFSQQNDNKIKKQQQQQINHQLILNRNAHIASNHNHNDIQNICSLDNNKSLNLQKQEQEQNLNKEVQQKIEVQKKIQNQYKEKENNHQNNENINQKNNYNNKTLEKIIENKDKIIEKQLDRHQNTQTITYQNQIKHKNDCPQVNKDNDKTIINKKEASEDINQISTNKKDNDGKLTNNNLQKYQPQSTLTEQKRQDELDYCQNKRNQQSTSQNKILCIDQINEQKSIDIDNQALLLEKTKMKKQQIQYQQISKQVKQIEENKQILEQQNLNQSNSRKEQLLNKQQQTISKLEKTDQQFDYHQKRINILPSSEHKNTLQNEESKLVEKDKNNNSDQIIDKQQSQQISQGKDSTTQEAQPNKEISQQKQQQIQQANNSNIIHKKLIQDDNYSSGKVLINDSNKQKTAKNNISDHLQQNQQQQVQKEQVQQQIVQANEKSNRILQNDQNNSKMSSQGYEQKGIISEQQSANPTIQVNKQQDIILRNDEKVEQIQTDQSTHQIEKYIHSVDQKTTTGQNGYKKIDQQIKSNIHESSNSKIPIQEIIDQNNNKKVDNLQGVDICVQTQEIVLQSMNSISSYKKITSPFNNQRNDIVKVNNNGNNDKKDNNNKQKYQPISSYQQTQQSQLNQQEDYHKKYIQSYQQQQQENVELIRQQKLVSQLQGINHHRNILIRQQKQYGQFMRVNNQKKKESSLLRSVQQQCVQQSRANSLNFESQPSKLKKLVFKQAIQVDIKTFDQQSSSEQTSRSINNVQTILPLTKRNQLQKIKILSNNQQQILQINQHQNILSIPKQQQTLTQSKSQYVSNTAQTKQTILSSKTQQKQQKQQQINQQSSQQINQPQQTTINNNQINQNINQLTKSINKQLNNQKQSTIINDQKVLQSKVKGKQYQSQIKNQNQHEQQLFDSFNKVKQQKQSVLNTKTKVNKQQSPFMKLQNLLKMNNLTSSNNQQIAPQYIPESIMQKLAPAFQTNSKNQTNQNQTINNSPNINLQSLFANLNNMGKITNHPDILNQVIKSTQTSIEDSIIYLKQSYIQDKQQLMQKIDISVLKYALKFVSKHFGQLFIVQKLFSLSSKEVALYVDNQWKVYSYQHFSQSNKYLQQFDKISSLLAQNEQTPDSKLSKQLQTFIISIMQNLISHIITISNCTNNYRIKLEIIKWIQILTGLNLKKIRTKQHQLSIEDEIKLAKKIKSFLSPKNKQLQGQLKNNNTLEDKLVIKLDDTHLGLISQLQVYKSASKSLFNNQSDKNYKQLSIKSHHQQKKQYILSYTLSSNDIIHHTQLNSSSIYLTCLTPNIKFQTLKASTTNINTFQLYLGNCILVASHHQFRFILYQQTAKDKYSIIKDGKGFIKYSAPQKKNPLINNKNKQVLSNYMKQTENKKQIFTQNICIRYYFKKLAQEGFLDRLIQCLYSGKAINNNGGYQNDKNLYLPVQKIQNKQKIQSKSDQKESNI